MVINDNMASLCFKALADSTRREILELLNQGNRSVVEIAERFPISRPAVSKHLRILREAGLVREQRSGRQRICELDGGPLQAVKQWLEPLDGQERTAAARGERRQPPAAPAAAANAKQDWRVW
jgi:DNA-binding transcriptional ArsR family regulator